MSNPNSAKNWPGILDSSHALKKFVDPLKAPSTGSNPSIKIAEHEAWQLNGDWQLARDPSRLTDAPVKKRPALPKRVERKIWSKPALVELTKRAVQSERAINHVEKQQAKKVQQDKFERLPAKPQKSQRAPLCKPKVPAPIRRQPQTQAVRRWRKRAVRTEKTKVSAIKIKKSEILETPRSQRPPLWKPKTRTQASRTPKAQTVRRFRSARPRNILVVDAKTEPMLRRDTKGGADQQLAAQESPRLRMSGRSKKSYGVPLCSRPTKIMGLGNPYSRQMQMRQEQLYQQPEYRDQYMRSLQQQARQQEKRQLEQLQAKSSAKMAIKSQDQQKLQHQLPVKPYAVPTKSQLLRLGKGNRLCGNFYYD